MAETIDSIIKWHTETFPDATLAGQEDKYREEFHEFTLADLGSGEELEELADLVIVSCGIMRFYYTQGFGWLVHTILHYGCTPHSHDALWRAVEKKMGKNRKRAWDKHGGQYQHKAGIED